VNGRKISSQQTIVYLEEFEGGFTMIWTIIFVVVLVVSIVLSVIAYNKYIDWMLIIGAIFITLSGVGAIFSLVMIVTNHYAIDKTIAVNQMEHDSIVKEIEALEQDTDEKVSRVTVIKDVQEWNSAIYSQKYWSESPWTNWFYSKEVVDSLEYIEMEE
jgi:hypothetical protein